MFKLSQLNYHGDSNEEYRSRDDAQLVPFLMGLLLRLLAFELHEEVICLGCALFVFFLFCGVSREIALFW